MIHLDTNVISEFSLPEKNDLRVAFLQKIEKNNEELLLDMHQIIEITKSSDKERVTERLNFLKKINNKRFLKIDLFKVVYQEIASVYLKERILSHEEFKDKFSIQLTNEQLEQLFFEVAPTLWNNNKEKFRAWQGTQIIGKAIFSFKKEKGYNKKRKIRDYLKLDPNISVSPFNKMQAIQQFDRYSCNNADVVSFGAYMHEVNRISSSGGKDLLNWINSVINKYHFPDEVWEWKENKFLDQCYLLGKCDSILEFLPIKNRDLDKIYTKLNMMDLKKFPSFFLIYKLTEYLKKRESKQKSGDIFDTLYSVLIPYTTVFTCDSDINESLKSIMSNKKIRVECKLYNMRQFLDEWLRI